MTLYQSLAVTALEISNAAFICIVEILHFVCCTFCKACLKSLFLLHSHYSNIKKMILIIWFEFYVLITVSLGQR